MRGHTNPFPNKPAIRTSLTVQRAGHTGNSSAGAPSRRRALQQQHSGCCGCAAAPSPACNTSPVHDWSETADSGRLAVRELGADSLAEPSSSLAPASAAGSAAQADDCSCSSVIEAASSSEVSAPAARASPRTSLTSCSACNGKGTLVCKACEGRGRLTRAGYNKRNTLNMQRIHNSKWTSMQETLGWRHFRVMQQVKGSHGLVFLLMQASCDPTAQLWLNSQILRDRSHWAAGWLPLSEMSGTEAAPAGVNKCGRGIQRD